MFQNVWVQSFPNVSSFTATFIYKQSPLCKSNNKSKCKTQVWLKECPIVQSPGVLMNALGNLATAYNI